MADGYHFSASSLKSLQHVLTDWFPAAVYVDLTDDTASVEVVIRKEFASGKGVFNASFIKADGSVIKSKEYAEDRMLGAVCKQYDPKKSRYDGQKEGFDHRLVCYAA
ncbi:MAG TPA: hypothetical protein VK642_15360 [Burkholderiales bacterium]|nr:hypothetical protein [Burkholderiales bacterium]